MTDSIDKNELLATVERSPEAVAVHDKLAWMSIFADLHVVEDPVGSTPHIGGIYDGVEGTRGHGALGRFFDTFIAPNKIAFDVQNDLVCANHVVRDLTINIQMSDSVHAQVPMHLLYELTEQNGEWKIKRLAAHWELIPMVMQLLKKGLAAAPVLGALTLRMMQLQGLFGMLGFSKAALNIGNAGKKVVQQFANVVADKSLSDLMGLFDHDAACIHLPYGSDAIEPSHLFDKTDFNVSFSKLLAAGDCITASCELELNGEKKAAVAIFEFNRKTKKINALRFYC
jgi:hypothetical protein